MQPAPVQKILPQLGLVCKYNSVEPKSLQWAFCSKNGTILLFSREPALGACETTNLSSGTEGEVQTLIKMIKGGSRSRPSLGGISRPSNVWPRVWPFAAKRKERCTKTQTYQPLVESHYSDSAKPYGESREWLGPAHHTGLGRVGPRLRNRAQLRKARGNSENDIGAEVSGINRNQKSRGQSSYNHFECQYLTSPLKSRGQKSARSFSRVLRGSSRQFHSLSCYPERAAVQPSGPQANQPLPVHSTGAAQVDGGRLRCEVSPTADVRPLAKRCIFQG
ncbi:hypothetical protein ABIB85_007359 [Bradyrhizobium sp. JR1.5]